ncbi:MAG: hypothetical protein IKL52_02210 [Candidatus Gastranaerophilales bacterium]|nr:hypothetical protein [Candidatus Gastranaerophilales bacterium]
MENYNNIFYSILALGGLFGAFKSIDWLISLKYQAKDECEKCRSNIFEIINKDRDLLVRLDAKMDLVLEQMKEKNRA